MRRGERAEGGTAGMAWVMTARGGVHRGWVRCWGGGGRFVSL